MIDRQTVLTAAHCIVKSFKDEHGNTINVEINALNPTYESIISVYLGVHDNRKAFTNNLDEPAIKVDVKQLIIVNSK